MSRKKGKNLATITGASDLLGVPVSSLYYYMLKGDISRHYVGTVPFVDVDKARAVLELKYRPWQKEGL